MSVAHTDMASSILLTVAQVAEICQVSRRTIERAIADGRLRAAPLGRHGAPRIRPEWLDEWIDGSVRHARKPRRPTIDLHGRPQRGRLTLAEGDRR